MADQSPEGELRGLLERGDALIARAQAVIKGAFARGVIDQAARDRLLTLLAEQGPQPAPRT